jgi:hypothetical protein
MNDTSPTFWLPRLGVLSAIAAHSGVWRVVFFRRDGPRTVPWKFEPHHFALIEDMNMGRMMVVCVDHNTRSRDLTDFWHSI